ncbi:MAG: hypothetical protein KBG15_05370 [Kofleriaceae bacterium]|nr:hypothetical protein [Kofleriaceae bacterium]
MSTSDEHKRSGAALQAPAADTPGAVTPGAVTPGAPANVYETLVGVAVVVPSSTSPVPTHHSGPQSGPGVAHVSGPHRNPHAAQPTPQPGLAHGHHPQGSYVPAPPPVHPVAALLEEVPGKAFTSFLKISLRRAFRLRIDPSEVLPAERHALQAANPPITDPNLAAFLAWRRSVLFLVAVALVPLTFVGLINSIPGDSIPLPIRMVRLGPTLAEGLFCIICWRQLKRWAHWRVQRRRLFYGWLLFMIAPFLVFIYPLRSIFEEMWHHKQSILPSMMVLGFQSGYKRSVLPYFFPMLAILQLAPKAISLMPGLVRSSMVIKLLFPGSSAPGWLIALAAPMYAIFAFVILIIPYQLTGSIWFIVGILGVVLGQALLARAGYGLARPLSEEQTIKQIARVRTWYVTVMFTSGVLIIIAMSSVVNILGLRITDVFLAVLKFETNVLILTMIGADLVVTNLDRARNYTEGGEPLEEVAEARIAAFVGLDKDS